MTITRRCATLLALSALAVAAPSAAASTPPQDLRSPDTRDAASGYDPEPVAVSEPSGSGRGFDWVSAAIGATAVSGLILLLAGFTNGGEWDGMGRIRRRGGRASGLLGDGPRGADGRRHVDEGGGQEQAGERDAEEGEAAERERQPARGCAQEVAELIGRRAQ